MADPLSVTAAGVGIAGASLHRREGPTLEEDIARLKISLVSIDAIQTAEWEKLGVSAAEQTKAVLRNCETACDGFRNSLTQWTRHSHDGDLPRRDRFTLGYYKEKEIFSVSQQLQSWKLSLTGTIGLANLYSSIWNGPTSNSTSDMLLSYREDADTANTKLQGQVAAIGKTRQDLVLDERPISDESVEEDIRTAIAQLKEERAAIKGSQALLKELAAKSEQEATVLGMTVTQHNRFGDYSSGVQLGYGTGTVNNYSGPQRQQG